MQRSVQTSTTGHMTASSNATGGAHLHANVGAGRKAATTDLAAVSGTETALPLPPILLGKLAVFRRLIQVPQRR